MPSLDGRTRSFAILVVQDHVEESAMDRQSGVIVFDKAQIPELIHEMTDPRTGRADHLRQRILIYCGNYGFGSTFLAEMSQQQQNPGQTLFAQLNS